MDQFDATKLPLDYLGVDLLVGAMLMGTAPEKERRGYVKALMATLKEKHRDDEVMIAYLTEHTELALSKALGLTGDAPSHPNDPSEEPRPSIAELLGLPQRGVLSDRAAAAWRRHVLLNIEVMRPHRTIAEERELRWRKPPAAHIEEFLRRNAIEFVPTIGIDRRSRITAALFVGPLQNRMLIAYEVVTKPFEVVFLIYHMYTHLMAGHVRARGFDCRLEYERGNTPTEVLGIPEYSEHEGIADDGATCLWDEWYIDSDQMTKFGRSLARGAMAEGLLDRELIRFVLRHRRDLLASVWKLLEAAGMALEKGQRLQSPLDTLSPMLGFQGPVAPVKGTDRQAYLLCIDETGRRRRQWIPSRKVLARLGLSVRDIVRIPDEELASYEDGRLLIGPAEVEEAAKLLKQT